MTDTVHTDLIMAMGSISSSVRNYLDKANWLVNIGTDEVDEKVVTNECFALVIQDLYEIGVEFHCAIGDLCDSLYHMSKVIDIAQIVLPSQLYINFSKNEYFKNAVKNIVDNGDPTGDSLIANVLISIFDDNTYPENTVFNEAHTAFMDRIGSAFIFVHDKITSTNTFEEYVKYMLSINEQDIVKDIDSDATSEYLSYIADQLNIYIKLGNILLRDYEDWVFEQYLCRVTYLKGYMSDPTSLCNYVWLHKNHLRKDLSALETTLVVKYTDMLEHSSPFYMPYYESRPQDGIPQHQYSDTEITCVIVEAIKSTASKGLLISTINNFKTMIRGRHQSDQLFANMIAIINNRFEEINAILGR